jgi:rare lipoprotein A (peptidoglycan hydrolase)
MKRLYLLVFALIAASALCFVLAMYFACRAAYFSEITVAPGPDRAAIERTAREIEAFNAETKCHAAAVDGFASWYGKKFEGKKTASGETYDRWALTCANRDLPLWTPVKLTNLANRRSVIVLVNDRGPYHKNRFGRYDRDFDLSEWAAYQLGIREDGVAKVEVAILEAKR